MLYKMVIYLILTLALIHHYEDTNKNIKECTTAVQNVYVYLTIHRICADTRPPVPVVAIQLTIPATKTLLPVRNQCPM